MTRRRIIAGVILLAAVVVAAPAVWERVAYREEKPSERWSFVILKKRRAWLPGREHVMPDQMCPYCEGGAHDVCRIGTRGYCPAAPLIEYPDDFRCTCTDPSHSDKP